MSSYDDHGGGNVVNANSTGEEEEEEDNSSAADDKSVDRRRKRIEFYNNLNNYLTWRAIQPFIQYLSKGRYPSVWKSRAADSINDTCHSWVR